MKNFFCHSYDDVHMVKLLEIVFLLDSCAAYFTDN